MGSWIKNNPVSYAIINMVICILLLTLIFKVYTDNRIDKRIIEEYQQPIVEKLDILINYYEDGRRDENRDNPISD